MVFSSLSSLLEVTIESRQLKQEGRSGPVIWGDRWGGQLDKESAEQRKGKLYWELPIPKESDNKGQSRLELKLGKPIGIMQTMKER